MRSGRTAATSVVAFALGCAFLTILAPDAESEATHDPAGDDLAVARVAAAPPPPVIAAPVALALGIAAPTDEALAHAATYAYGPLPHQVLDVLVPAGAPPGGAPVLLYLHAGGWIAGERADVPDLVARELARGWAVVSVDYGLAVDHRFPAPVEDADRAVRWIRAHGAALGLRADVVVAVGASAGGHLAAWLAADPDAHRADDAALAGVPSGVEGAVLLVAPVVMSDLAHHDDTFAPAILAAYLGCPEGRADRCDPAVLAAADPTRAVAPKPAPVYVLHGGQDGMFPAAVHGRAIADSWRAAGGLARVEAAPFAGHNLDGTNVDVTAIDRFLDDVLIVNPV